MGAPGAVGEYLTQLVHRLEGMRGIYAGLRWPARPRAS
jgi:hypothetical protein